MKLSDLDRNQWGEHPDYYSEPEEIHNCDMCHYEPADYYEEYGEYFCKSCIREIDMSLDLDLQLQNRNIITGLLNLFNEIHETILKEHIF